ncbi:hypothetical protein EVG20_g3557 [Dentipellis fragilis]|uniref:Plasmid pRiA4b Orf3-like domain-containing protein n=1 Tax=Dentipellis fragilis TaxID=205917 RepID=A0A4Y9Z3E8_9AGAM|nr:hypothetical protein EVG20_g3557 [Dentipellis fragilis]
MASASTRPDRPSKLEIRQALRKRWGNGLAGIDLDKNENWLRDWVVSKAEFVRFHPQDDPSAYPVTLYGHPDRHKPMREGRRKDAGYVEQQDLHPAIMESRMLSTNFYRGYDDPTLTATPQVQFINRLIELQIEKLSKMDLGDLQHRDYTLRIVMDHAKDRVGNDMIWREFRVSGGLSIAALSDKILTPLMGWVRNYHAHASTVYKDGAVYGPTDFGGPEVVHKHEVGYAFVPESSSQGIWTVAHLLQDVGEGMIWTRDYGSHFTHVITVEDIAPVEESTGKVAIIDGAGACPPEDYPYIEAWVDDIAKLRIRSPNLSLRDTVLDKMRGALNYKGTVVTAVFDPDDFDLPAARQRVHDALASPASALTVPKQILLNLGLDPDALDPESETASLDPTLNPSLKKGQVLQRTWDTSDEGNSNIINQEVISTMRDRKDGGCCWVCGSPHNFLKYVQVLGRL